mmetsp:Transcript_11574/g.17487  ORF Transcript_11574/g.17487 Transcript_11574/m.17487 type:complete len:172 (+) Transcript_11574:1051-1566(+)
MNVFNPLASPRKKSPRKQGAAGDESPDLKPSIKHIQDIYNDDTVSPVKMKNESLQQKTVRVQQEFQNLMDEMVNRRSQGLGMSHQAMPDVDSLLDGYYLPGKEKKHRSPTKRLINFKNSTWDHKKRIQDGVHKGEYSQTYCVAPGKSYVIEAQGGELPYEMAERSPSKFYN